MSYCHHSSWRRSLHRALITIDSPRASVQTWRPTFTSSLSIEPSTRKQILSIPVLKTLRVKIRSLRKDIQSHFRNILLQKEKKKRRTTKKPPRLFTLLIIQPLTYWSWFQALTHINSSSNQFAIISDNSIRLYWSSSQVCLKDLNKSTIFPSSG